jgi:hypothetical protein
MGIKPYTSSHLIIPALVNAINSYSGLTYCLQMKPRHPAHGLVTTQHYTKSYYTKSPEKKESFYIKNKLVTSLSGEKLK